MIFSLMACADEPELTAVLLELGQVSSTEVMPGLYSAIEDTVEELEDGASATGTLDFPSDAGASWDVDGELAVEWNVVFREDAYGETRRWDWSMTITLARLALPSAEVAGEAVWAVEWETWDTLLLQHDWSGVISVDDAEPVHAEWLGWGTTAALNRLAGSIDGEAVDWENPNPDLP